MKTVFEGEDCRAIGLDLLPGIKPGFGRPATQPNTRDEAPTHRVKPTIVAVTVELGRGDAIFIRGQGGGLRWDKGRPLAPVGPEHWMWLANGLQEDIEFQLLLNDQIWARGKNLVLRAGEKVEVSPDFEWPEIPRTT